MPFSKTVTARKDAQEYLGSDYPERLLAAYSVLIDGEGLLKKYGEGNVNHALCTVCDAFRNLREVGNMDF